MFIEESNTSCRWYTKFFDQLEKWASWDLMATIVHWEEIRQGIQAAQTSYLDLFQPMVCQKHMFVGL